MKIFRQYIEIKKMIKLWKCRRYENLEGKKND